MLQKRYDGLLKTSFLWRGDSVENLHQLEVVPKSAKINVSIDESLRLGKYVERLVSFELNHQEGISILAENIQIQKDKTTLGELDCLLLKDGKPMHLEIIYKFYLYDASVGTAEIEHFVGPNRKDALVEKLAKLKEKQLPLLYSGACKSYLNNIGLKAEDFFQRVYFKAQLFVPFSNRDIQLQTLNNACVSGFYIRREELGEFKGCKFYLPDKKDWLVMPHAYVRWLGFARFCEIAKHYFAQHYSALFWVKSKKGTLMKLFLVWW